MGNLKSICRGDKDDQPIVSNSTAMSKRENMATWHRTDIAVTDVYDIVETIGKGRMGEVYKVMRHVEDRGLHNHDTRTKSVNIDRSKSESTIDHAIESQVIHSPSDGKSRPKPILRKASRGNLIGMSNSESSLVGTIGNRDSTTNASGNLDEESDGSGTTPESVCSIRSVGNKLVSNFMFDSDEDDNVSQRSIVSTESTKGLSKKKKNSRKARLRFQRTYACKTVETADIKQKQLEEMMKEIYVMRTLDHPYIIRLYEVYQVKRK